MDAFAEYLRLVDALGRENGSNPLWWATDAASKNRVRSPLLWLLRAEGPPAGGHTPELRALRILGSQLRRQLRRIRLARTLFPGANASADPKQPVSVIKTFAYPSSLGLQGFSDPFFPGLAKHIAMRCGAERRVLTVCVDFDDSGEVMRRMAGLGNPDLLPLEALLTPADAIAAALRLLPGILPPGFRTPSAMLFQGRDVAAPVARSLRGGGGLPLDQYLHRKAAVVLGARHAVDHCVLTYEGNPWERMFCLGLRSSGPGTEIIGCQHSAVTQASAGLFPGEAELALSPMPDRVLTTGEATAAIIRRYGNWPSSRVQASCALRYSGLHALPFEPRAPGETMRVLVAPEGLDEAIDMVAYALRQAHLCQDTVFRFRAHPVLPLDRFLERLEQNLAEYPNVEKSRAAKVEEDVAECDAVLYWGSTVCMEALMMGVPVIHFDRGDRPSYDPLFEGCAYQWIVAGDKPLAAVLAQLRSLPQQERDERAASARAYAASHFHPVTPQRLDAFLPSRLAT